MKAKGPPAGGTSLANILDRVVERVAAKEPASFADLVAAAGLDPGQDFVGASLVGLDLRGEDLRGFDFANANLQNADFRGANMNGVSIAGADTTGALGLPLPIPPRSEPERARDGSVMFEGVRLTLPDRVLYPDTTLTKLDVARYYTAIQKWILPSSPAGCLHWCARRRSG